MPLGHLQLQLISLPGREPQTFQIRHEGVDGAIFVGSVEKEHLLHFLRDDLRMDPELIERLLGELYLTGHAFVPAVSIPYIDLAGSGLHHLPDQR